MLEGLTFHRRQPFSDSPSLEALGFSPGETRPVLLLWRSVC